MKKTIIPFLLLLITFNINAQTPQSIPYQAIARDAAGNAFANRGLEIRFTIIDSAINGSVVYQEKHTTVTSAFGLFTLNVGQGVASIGSFANIKWNRNAKFLQVEMDTLSAGNWVNLGTQQMLSVPYSLYAEKAGNSFTHYIGELYGGGIVFEVYKDTRGEEHGLIASLKEVSTSQVWSNVDNVLVGASAQSAWDGMSNTNAIINQTGHTISAAYMCDTLTVNGYSDWYLPAIQQLQTLMQNSYQLNRIISTIIDADLIITLPSSFSGLGYWSSTEYPSTTNSTNLSFCYIPISSNSLGGIDKKQHAKFYVRAIRSF